MKATPAHLLLAFLLHATAVSALAPDEIFPVDEVRRGMRGYGLTVVEGTRIDTFRVELLDVMRGRGRSGDIILVTVSGLDIEENGIAQGMSGSPVFVDGRLLGALAYGYPYAKKSIAGITPIGEMLGVLERDEAETALGSIPAPFGGGGSDELSQWPGPIVTPLSLSGFAPDVAKDVEEFFRPFGMVPTAGGVGGRKVDGEEWEALPGAAVGVSLLSGDAGLSALGTLTWVEGDNILAFGHPLFQAGSVRFPLVSASVHTIIPSRYISFKLGSPIETVGALTQDRRPGIGGSLALSAPTVPIDVKVTVPGIGTESFHYEAVREKRLTPKLVAWAVNNSILCNEKAIGESVVRVRLSLELDGAPDLTRENIYSSSAVLRDVADDILFPMQVLANNPIAGPDIKSVRVEVEIADGREAARIEEIRVERARIRPGETLRGSVLFRRFQGATERRRFELRIPPEQPEGLLLLRVCDALSSDEYDLKRAPYRFVTDRIDRLVRILEEFRSNDGIYCLLYNTSGGATVSGREMPLLPGSVLSVLKSPTHMGDADATSGSVVAKQILRVDAFTRGCRSLPIKVDRTAP